MTHRELLNAPRKTLSSLEQQRQQRLHADLSPVPCPSCRQRVSAVQASGRELEHYPLEGELPRFHCPHCQVVLEQVVPFSAAPPGWFWQLPQDWLAERLRKAQLYDLEHSQEQP